MLGRRTFLKAMTLGCTGLKCTTGSLLLGSQSVAAEVSEDDFCTLVKNLLAEWCRGMLERQINDPLDPTRHGGLACPSCDFIHGRCWEVVYPFLHMANTRNEPRYLEGAIRAYEWAENNVSQPDGSWSNDMDPTSWRGTTIFGAIAMAEALNYHGDLLDEDRRAAWASRLDKAAGGYLFRDFRTIDFTNLNYGISALYGFHLFGRILGKEKYFQRSQDLSAQLKEFFTQPNKLIYGEGKPNNGRSGRGLLPVDLGYNVEESLNGAVLYALEVNDAELLDLLVGSLNGHLEFMLPDGAWDNSWGTRQAKWTYWGSRTSDGCQPAFGLMAKRNPAFGTAAYKNAELLKRCTAQGLLHGGPHYVSHGVSPCIHHTFAHAKVMALLQDKKHSLPSIDKSTPLPRETANGVKSFPEIAVWLAARGPWRGTVSAYDSIYRTKSTDQIQQASGGSLAVLYHKKVGTLLAASMARYILVEERNQQPQPGQDFAFTTRIETRQDDSWYTNLYDLEAGVSFTDDGERITFDVKTRLQDEDRYAVPDDSAAYDLMYQFEKEKVTISASRSGKATSNRPTTLVVPIISPSGEVVRQVADRRIEIDKPGGTVVVECNVPLSIKSSEKGRIFNMVPGAEALPVLARLPRQPGMKAELTLSIA